MNKKAFKKDINNIVKTMTYVEALEKGIADYEDIIYYIEQWHKSNSKLEVYEYLGMTNEQYGKYVEEHINGLKRMFPRNE